MIRSLVGPGRSLQPDTRVRCTRCREPLNTLEVAALREGRRICRYSGPCPYQPKLRPRGYRR